jgi:hypothetical protein
MTRRPVKDFHFLSHDDLAFLFCIFFSENGLNGLNDWNGLNRAPLARFENLPNFLAVFLTAANHPLPVCVIEILNVFLG